MLKKLILKGFQKHQYLEVDFDPYITSLVGRSDIGKSTIIRALYWLCFNKPDGIKEILNWTCEEVEVTLYLDDHIIIRRRSAKENVYILNGSVLKVEGNRAVPTPVAQVLHVCKENFSFQLDPPFWFTLSAPEVSRELNRIVDLSTIDNILTDVAKEVSQAKAEANVCQVRLNQAKQEKDSLYWVNDLDDQLKKVEELAATLLAKQQKIAIIRELLQKGVGVGLKVDRLGNALLGVTNVVSLGNSRLALQKQRLVLTSLLNKAQKLALEVNKRIPDTTKLAELLKTWKIASKKKVKLQAAYLEAKRCLVNLEEVQSQYATSLKDLEKFRQSLPQQCPLCLQETMK